MDNNEGTPPDEPQAERKKIYFHGPAAVGMNEENMREVLTELEERGRRAKEEGFVIEAIAIRAYLIEFWLRIHIVNHTHEPFVGGDTLGRVVDRAADCHLSGEAIGKLRAFVTRRNQAIHRLLEGKQRYDDLWGVFDEGENLVGVIAGEVIERHLASASTEPPPGWEDPNETA